MAKGEFNLEEERWHSFFAPKERDVYSWQITLSDY